MPEEPTFTIGSGNVFADLGLPEPEEALAKAELVRQIAEAIRERGLTQQQAAGLLGIDQPKVSALLRGRLSGFSLERLLRCVRALGYGVTISIRPEMPPHIGLRVRGRRACPPGKRRKVIHLSRV